ncbi:carboxypeptidase-like regulatory domain-containing protein [Flavobacterium sp.]|jgi:hypothetical protein|uniref:carboxypeptidase-like regulatory domain-containing protein n=1 Tax=Flavobacterium sp. TaxID=239 RepID=UPI0037BECDBE
MKINILFYFLFFSNILFSQTVIRGGVTNSNNEPLNNVNILINYKSTDDLIVFSTTDKDGLFVLEIDNKISEFDIQLSCIGYKTITETLKNESRTRNFVLNEQEIELSEVVVKAPPIIQKGDTIKYTVGSFSKEQDRSIGDVLKRIPGIEVLADGQIRYQGKPINKYYIEGLDLLEGKYNLANENLSYKEVTQVQILENHQPIKALDSLKFSENAAINIKLKNAYTIAGSAQLGSGFSPLLWESNITPMLFTKKNQMLISAQSNNVGNNVANQLKNLTIENLLNPSNSESEKSDWLFIQQLSAPDFTEKRWLDNNVHLLTGNYLHKLKNDYEIRLNISYLNDVQQQNGSTFTKFITPSDTIKLLEKNQNFLFLNSLQTNLTLHKNSEKKYFKNSFEFQGFWDSQRGNIVINEQNIDQQLSNRFFKLSNNLKTILPLGKKLLTLYSFISINRTPQSLTINPGQFPNLINNNIPYKEISQNVNLKKILADNYISFTKGFGGISVDSKFGFQLENQNLSSQIQSSENINLSNNFSNDLDWLKTKLFIEVQTQYKRNRWSLDFALPTNLYSFNVKDEKISKGENFSRITFEPRLSATYDVNNFWKLNTVLSLNNQFGNINQLHYAYILQNYRSIRRINAPLPQNLDQTISSGIFYRNPMRSFFWHLMYSNATNKTNITYQSEILENGTTELKAIQQDNLQQSQSVATRFNKKFKTLQTNLILNASYSLSTNFQLLNDNLTKVNNQTYNFGNKVEIDFTDRFTFEYQSTWIIMRTLIQNQENPAVTQENHLATLTFFTGKQNFISLRTEYTTNNFFSERTEFVFSDLIYRYSIKKRKIDFEFQLNNLLNTSTFRSVDISDFTYLETNFLLRPRQFIFKVTFTL